MRSQSRAVSARSTNQKRRNHVLRSIHYFRPSTCDIGPLNIAATQAAFQDTSDWLPQLLEYLQDNAQRVAAVAGARMTPVEATYLAWIDLRELGLQRPAKALEAHGIGLSEGADFGGPGFVRFNFGCPRALLDEGLERFAVGLEALGGAPGAGAC